MNLPTFERPSSFFLFIGFGMLFYILGFLIKSGEIVDQKKYDGTLKILQLKYDQKLDSSECVALSEKILRLKAKLNPTESSEEIHNLSLTIIKKTILNKKRSKEVEIIDSNINKVSEQYKYDSTGFWQIFALILSFILIATGLIFLFKEYEHRNEGIVGNSPNRSPYTKHITRQKLKDYFKK